MKKIKLPTKKGHFTVNEWARIVGVSPAMIYIRISSNNLKLRDYFKRNAGGPKANYEIPLKNQVGRFARREWARLKNYKVVNFLAWLDQRPEHKQLFKVLRRKRPKTPMKQFSPKVILPEGVELKKFSVPEWTKTLKIHKKSIYCFLKRRGLKSGDFFKVLRKTKKANPSSEGMASNL